MIVMKQRTSNLYSWLVYHRGYTSNVGSLNSTAAFNFSSLIVRPTPSQETTHFQVSGTYNGSGETHVAYLFAHNNNDGGFGPDSEDIIKCGATGAYTAGTPLAVNLGFEPQWVLVKRYDGTDGWYITDTMRGMEVYEGAYLRADSSNVETDSANYGVAAPTPTGFILDPGSSSLLASGNYIYMAIRRPDMSTPTVASEVFSIDSQGSSAPYFDSTHIVDMALVRPMGSGGSGGGGAFNYARLMGEKYLKTSGTNAEANASEAGFDFMNGHIDQNWGGTNTYSWMWKRARGYFDVVAYTGTGSGAQNVSHNLGVVPEMMWIKVRSDTDNWVVYHSAVGNTKRLMLNSADGPSSANSIFFNNTTPTSSVFTAGSLINASQNYIAYLFATVAGVSKVGTYTGDGSAGKVIDCGFTNGAKFVLIKELSDSHNWYVWDTTRGISSGNDPYFFLNTTAAENDQADSIDPDSSGFAVNYALTNSNGETYIFYAIATDPS